MTPEEFQNILERVRLGATIDLPAGTTIPKGVWDCSGILIEGGGWVMQIARLTSEDDRATTWAASMRLSPIRDEGGLDDDTDETDEEDESDAGTDTPSLLSESMGLLGVAGRIR